MMPHRSKWLGVMLAIFLSSTILYAPAGAGTFSLVNDSALILTDVSGPGDESSSLTEGMNFYSILDLSSRGKVKDFDYSLSLGFKATDDERRDIEEFSLTSFRGRISNRIHTFNAGDTYESFSKYSLNTAIKGVSYRYSDMNNLLPEITLLGGMAYSRWDNFWDNDAVERVLYGARVKQQLTADLWIAGSFVRVEDDERYYSVPLYDGQTYTLDMEYQPLPGLTIIAEGSVSDIEADNASQSDTRHRGQAYRLQAIGDEDPSRVDLEYEWIDPDYLTVAGSATPDREKAKASWRYKVTKLTTITSSLLWYRDNLDGQLAERTDHYKPQISISQRQFLGRRHARATLSYNYDRASGAREERNHFISGNYTDRFGSLDSSTNVGVTFYDMDTARDSQEYLVNTALNARFSRGDFIWKPGIYLGSWMAEDELSDQTDYVYEYSLSLGCDIPRIKLTTQFKVGHHELLKDSGDDSKKLYGQFNAYYRPQFLAQFKSSTLYLRAFVNDFSYTTDSRDFRENRVTAGINIRY